MFKKQDIGVLAWMILIIILSIPVINFIFVLWALLSSKVNRTVKNFFVAYLVFWFLAIFGIFDGTFEAFRGLFG
jgi:hypothetical protein